MAVFVLDKRGKPLMPCSEKRARLLLACGRARVHRVMPFAIRLVDRRQADSHIGRVAIRATGSFNIQTAEGVVQGVSHRDCTLMQRGDGYGYSRVAPSTKESGRRGDASRRALSLTGLKADVSRAH